MAPPAVTSPFAATPGAVVTEVRDAAPANPGHEARAAEEEPKQKEKSKPKPEQSNPKPEQRVELSSSDSGDSDQTVPTKAAPNQSLRVARRSPRIQVDNHSEVLPRNGLALKNAARSPG